jgi:hypothetical protein
MNCHPERSLRNLIARGTVETPAFACNTISLLVFGLALQKLLKDLFCLRA